MRVQRGEHHRGGAADAAGVVEQHGAVNGGWPSYEFGDGSNGFSGILRKPTGEPSVRVYSRSIADTPNCYAVEFQDALNGYQQDSYSLVDPDDVALSGQQVSATLTALGIAELRPGRRGC